MQKLVLHTKHNIVALCLLGILSSFFSVPSITQELVVIGHSSTVKSTISETELNEILKAERIKWNNGKTIVIALMKFNEPTGKLTAKELYKTTGNEMNRFWMGIQFEDKADGPKNFTSEEELVNYVAKTPYAIGVIAKQTNIGNAKKINIR